jgi:hypothetical protein
VRARRSPLSTRGGGPLDCATSAMLNVGTGDPLLRRALLLFVVAAGVVVVVGVVGVVVVAAVLATAGDAIVDDVAPTPPLLVDSGESWRINGLEPALATGRSTLKRSSESAPPPLPGIDSPLERRVRRARCGCRPNAAVTSGSTTRGDSGERGDNGANIVSMPSQVRHRFYLMVLLPIGVIVRSPLLRIELAPTLILLEL